MSPDTASLCLAEVGVVLFLPQNSFFVEVLGMFLALGHNNLLVFLLWTEEKYFTKFYILTGVHSSWY